MDGLIAYVHVELEMLDTRDDLSFIKAIPHINRFVFLSKWKSHLNCKREWNRNF